MAHKHIHVFYSGLVQGVGFRYTARGIASRLGLDGWARNLRDGRVEVVCEGEEQGLKAFLEKIKDEFPGHYINNVDISWEKPSHQTKGFEIRF